MSSPMVELIDISKKYRRGKEEVAVLDNLNLTVEQCDFLSLMGPSGSGKTTMLNIIGGLDSPSSGAVKINGNTITEMSNKELANWRSKNVGFIFQFYNLMPILTAEKNVELPLLLTSMTSKQRKERAQIALDIVGLSDRRQHKPNELSGGQQQRVAIARAIVTDPNLLVCDEPTGDLDRESSEEILELLRILNTEHNKTIIMVTHDINASNSAKTKYIMDKGLLVKADEAGNLGESKGAFLSRKKSGGSKLETMA